MRPVDNLSAVSDAAVLGGAVAACCLLPVDSNVHLVIQKALSVEREWDRSRQPPTLPVRYQLPAAKPHGPRSAWQVRKRGYGKSGNLVTNFVRLHNSYPAQKTVTKKCQKFGCGKPCRNPGLISARPGFSRSSAKLQIQHSRRRHYSGGDRIAFVQPFLSVPLKNSLRRPVCLCS